MEEKSSKHRRVLSKEEFHVLQQRLNSSAELTSDEREVLGTILDGYAWTQHELQNAKCSIARLKNFFGLKTEKKRVPFVIGMMSPD